jgi:hypothetical protein
MTDFPATIGGNLLCIKLQYSCKVGEYGNFSYGTHYFCSRYFHWI